MLLASDVERIREAYLDALRNDYTPISLPKREQHEETLAYVNASDLGYCPLKAFRKRTQVPFVDPAVEKNVDLEQRMEIGKRIGHLYQEAFLFDSPHHEVEAYFRNDQYRIKGSVDVLYYPDSLDGAVIEIKSSDAHNQEWELRPQYIFQTMAYGLQYPNLSMHILTVKWRDFNIWTLHPWNGGFVLENQHGRRWPHVLNNPEYLNYGTLHHEIEYHLRYLNGATAIPFNDPVLERDNGGWQCAKPEGNWVKPICGYKCHFGSEEKLPITNGEVQWPSLF